MQVLILAGGKGTRLSSVLGDLPKPLVDVCGVPLLGRQLQMLAEQDLRKVMVLTGHGGDQIADYCGDGSRWGLALHCEREITPRGTAGAVVDVLDRLEQRFVIMYGDTVMDVDLRRMIDAHAAAHAAASLFLHPNDHPHDSDLVEVDNTNWVRAFHPHPHPPGAYRPNLVNAALYVLERDALATVDGLPEKPDFGHHVFPRMLEIGLAIRGYKSPEYIKDAGTPKRIEKVCRDLESGKVADRSFRSKAAAVFLDRDGVLNMEKGLITSPEQLTIVPRAPEAVRKLNESRYRAIVTTNQPVVARGDTTFEELERIHGCLEEMLGRDGAYLEAIYTCPHHPDGGFEGEVPALKIVCGCRKPATGLIEKAAADFNLDLRRSWMIGDRTVDIEMAKRAGLRSILVRTGYGGSDARYDVKPDFIAADVLDAVNLILAQTPNPQDIEAQP